MNVTINYGNADGVHTHSHKHGSQEQVVIGELSFSGKFMWTMNIYFENVEQVHELVGKLNVLAARMQAESE